jgi:hypothetical protein
MTMTFPTSPQTPMSPQNNLEELKRRLSQAQEVVVGPSGQLHNPNDPKVANTPPQEKTVLKPQRWFQS